MTRFPYIFWPVVIFITFGVGVGIGGAVTWLVNTLLFPERAPEFTGTDYED